MWSFPYKLIGKMMPIMSKLIAGRARGMFILNAVSFFSVIFKAVSYFFPE